MLPQIREVVARLSVERPALPAKGGE